MCLVILLLLTGWVSFACEQPPPALPPQPWIDRPVDQWPTIALTSHIRLGPMDFRDRGGAFLIDTGTDTLAAAPKHLFLVFKNSDIQAIHFAGLPHSWTMSPQGDPSDSVVTRRLLNEDLQEKIIKQYLVNRDWLVFSVAAKVPSDIQPLKPRFGQLEKGQQVYLIGWTENGGQPVFTGTIYESYEYKYLIDFGEQDVAPFGGAPVVDNGGYLIGIHTGKIGEVSWVNSTRYLKEILESR